MKKNIFRAAFIILLLIVLVVLVRQKSQPGNSINIGSILILTGEGASWGEAARNGISMAVDDINRQGGVNGKLLKASYEDDADDPKRTISAFQKFVGEGTHFIIGPSWSNVGLPLVDLAKQYKTVMISPSLGVKEFNENNDYLFNTWPHDFILSKNLADYVFQKGYRNVAVYGAQQVWVKDQTNAFTTQFKALGGNIGFLSEPQTTVTDMRTEIAKMESNSHIDAVVMLTDGQNITPIIGRQLKQLRVNLPIFSVTLDRKIISDCEGACDDAVFLTFLTPTSDFEQRYRQKFNREVEIGADSAYDAVMMLAQAMRETNSTDPELVKKYLSNIKNYNGVSGTLVSDGVRGFTKDFIVKQIKSGEPVTILK